ncbi:MAG TPA: hypothetical protein VJP02_04640 [Candidatus Sulfotelmatobacter sp.]|nr:hypothetical protein [Candidatus Sulfotelmatobacter sp.]
MAGKKRAKVPRELLRQQPNLTEIAVLQMTNNPDSKAKPKKSQPVVLTTKQSYLWAAFLAFVAEKYPGISPEQIALTVATRGLSPEFIRRAYRDFDMEHETETVSALKILQATMAALKIESSPRLFAEHAKSAYDSLVRKGLIEDPLEIMVGGIAVAVLGLLPFSFTQKTKAGQKVSKKLKALYWQYEKSENRGVVTTNVEFRLLKMIKAFHAGMIGGFSGILQQNIDSDVIASRPARRRQTQFTVKGAPLAAPRLGKTRS